MCATTTKYVLKMYLKGPSNRLKMHYQCTKYRNTRHLRTKFSKFSQVKSKDHCENIFGIEMRPYEKKPVKMCAKNQICNKNVHKQAFKSTRNAVLMYKKTKYPTSKDNNTKILTSEKQRPL